MSAPLTSGFSAGRRRFLLGLGSLGITSALPLTTFTPAEAHAENWSGGQKATPARIFYPASEGSLAAAIRETRDTIRAFGGGHAYTPVAPP